MANIRIKINMTKDFAKKTKKTEIIRKKSPWVIVTEGDEILWIRGGEKEAVGWGG